jgi:hypothetical protein
LIYLGVSVPEGVILSQARQRAVEGSAVLMLAEDSHTADPSWKMHWFSLRQIVLLPGD